ncbi:MAG: DUF4114 domain-containing protein [Amphiplicatus sp.]
MLSKLRAAVFAVASAAAMGVGSANAVIVNAVTNQIESEGLGDIHVVFDSVSAGDSSNVVSIDYGATPLFNNQTDPVGTLVNIGFVAPGEGLEFRLDNLTKGMSFITGLAADNIDGVIHALLSTNPDGSITVSFEDLPDGGDFDYNDVVFTVYETPIPGALLLLLTGMAGLGAASRGRKTA